VRFLVKRRRVSERRACRVVEQHRSTQRYERVAPEYELRLVKRMNELAAAHPRYGYRRVWALLTSEGWRVNRKRVERLWRLEGHRVPPRRRYASGKKAQGTAANAIWNLPATEANHVWSYDFMSGRTRDGGSLRILNVVDEYTRVALGCRVDRSIGASDVAHELERLFDRHGKPHVRPPSIWSRLSVGPANFESQIGGGACARSVTAWSRSWRSCGRRRSCRGRG
jgi:putative transposase